MPRTKKIEEEKTLTSKQKKTKKNTNAKTKKVASEIKKPRVNKRTSQKAIIAEVKNRKIESIVENSLEKERVKRIIEEEIAKVKAKEEEEAQRAYLMQQKKERKKFALIYNFISTLSLLCLAVALLFILSNRLAFSNVLQNSSSTYLPNQALLSNWLIAFIYLTFVCSLLLTGCAIAQFVLCTCSKKGYEKSGELSLLHKATYINTLITFIISCVLFVLTIVVFALTTSYYSMFSYPYNAFWIVFPMILSFIISGVYLSVMIFALKVNKKIG